MSLITDALRKADSSLSTATLSQSQPESQTPSPNPTAEPTPPPEASGMRLSHAAFLIACIALGYVLFTQHSSAPLRSQKIEVQRIPRSSIRPLLAVDSYDKLEGTTKGPFSSTLSPQTASRFPSKKSIVTTQSVPATASPAPALDNKIGSEMLQAMTGQWRLNGIIRGGAGKPLAMVNNELVQEGDLFHGARVARISDDQVVMEADGHTQSLRLE